MSVVTRSIRSRRDDSGRDRVTSRCQRLRLESDRPASDSTFFVTFYCPSNLDEFVHCAHIIRTNAVSKAIRYSSYIPQAKITHFITIIPALLRPPPFCFTNHVVDNFFALLQPRLGCLSQDVVSGGRHDVRITCFLAAI